METFQEKVQNVFSPWHNDEKFKSWIHEVPSDKNLFYCSSCNKTFFCGSTNVKRHTESARHKYIISKKNSQKIRKVKEPLKKTFMPQWLENEEFKPWLHNVVGDPFSCFCSVCEKSFACGLSQINRHADTKCHIQNCEKNGIDVSKSNKDFSMQYKPLSFEERTKIAELRFAALVVEENISHQSAEAILKFFQDVGKDLHVLENMTFGQTKYTNI